MAELQCEDPGLFRQRALKCVTTPQELDAHVAHELEKWVRVTQAARLSVH